MYDLLSPYFVLPRLLLPSSDTFYSLDDGDSHALELKSIIGTHNRSICGSSHGWLALVDENSPLISLLNPITTQKIQLPPFTTLPGVLDYRSSETEKNRLEYQMPVCIYTGCLCRLCFLPHSENASSWFTDETKMQYVKKIILSGNPLCQEGCIAMVVFKGCLAFCRVASGEAESCWTAVHRPDGVIVEDLASCKGQLYALYNDGLWVCNLTDPVPHMEIVLNPTTQMNCGKMLVATPDSNLYLISKEFDEYVSWTTGFSVHTLSEERDSWIVASGIGDYVIFLDPNASLCLSASDFLSCHLKTNRIYFTGSPSVAGSSSVEHNSELVYDSGIYNLQTRRIERLPISAVLSSHLPPVWLLPSITVD